MFSHCMAALDWNHSLVQTKAGEKFLRCSTLKSRNPSNYTRTVLKAWFILSTALTTSLSCNILCLLLQLLLFSSKRRKKARERREGGKGRDWRGGREEGKETEREMPLIVYLSISDDKSVIYSLLKIFICVILSLNKIAKDYLYN